MYSKLFGIWGLNVDGSFKSLCSNISGSALFSDKNEDSKIVSGSSGPCGSK